MRKLGTIRLISVCCASLVLILVLSCAGTTTPTPTGAATPTATPTGAAAPKVFKLGAAVALSGAASAWGIRQSRGIELAAEEINAAGGMVVGGERYIIQVISYDNKLTTATSAAVTTKLIFEDGVRYILCSTASSPALAVQSIAEPQKVIHFTQAGAKEFLAQDKPYSFRGFPDIMGYVSGEHPWVKANYPNVKRSAVIYRNDATGLDFAASVAQVDPTLGWEVVAKEVFEPGTTEFTPILRKVMATNPDVIELSAVSFGEGTLEVKQLHELGYKGIILWGGSSQSADDFVKGVPKEAAEGVILGNCWDYAGPLATPAEQKIAKTYSDRYGEAFAATSALTYEVTKNIVIPAILAVGSFDTTKVAEYMRTHVFDGIHGKLAFGGQATYGIRNQILVADGITVIKGGVPVPVAAVVPVELQELLKK